MFSLTNLGWNEDWQNIAMEYKKKNLSPARVCSESKNRYEVICEEKLQVARMSDIMYKSSINSFEKPVVGDWVLVEKRENCDWLTICYILPRKSYFARKQKNTFGRNFNKPGSSDEQVISANIDIVFLVFSLSYDFSLRTIERYLLLAHRSQAMPVILLNKVDLCLDKEEKYKEVLKIANNTPVYLLSALKNEGLAEIMKYVRSGITISLIGSSGVGKSTLINAICGDALQSVNETRLGDDRGKHTTTSRDMVFLNNGGILIDNPGLRDVKILGDDSDLEFTFGDVVQLEQECRFSDCKHQTEPGCAILEAISSGLLDQDRLASYLTLKAEVNYQKERSKQRIKKEEHQRSKLKKSGLDKVFANKKY